MYRILFFCFKQKTSYELRISDWSSDWCSSDLPNFVDMDNFFAVFAREEVLKSRAEALRGDEAAYNWSIDRRPNFAKLTQVVFEEGGTAWAGDDDFALGERLGAFRHTRC